MNRPKAVLTLIAVLLGGVASAPALAWGHAHVRFGVFVGAPFYPWYYPPYYYYPPYPVVVSPPTPTTYVEKDSAPTHSAPAYWYYCEASKTYYPYVKECPAGWLRVAPHATPQTAPPAVPQARPQSSPQAAPGG